MYYVMGIFRVGSQFSSLLICWVLFSLVRGKERGSGVNYSFPPVLIYLDFTVPGSVLAACGVGVGDTEVNQTLSCSEEGHCFLLATKHSVIP